MVETAILNHDANQACGVFIMIFLFSYGVLQQLSRASKRLSLIFSWGETSAFIFARGPEMVILDMRFLSLPGRL